MILSFPLNTSIYIEYIFPYISNSFILYLQNESFDFNQIIYSIFHKKILRISNNTILFVIINNNSLLTLVNP